MFLPFWLTTMWPESLLTIVTFPPPCSNVVIVLVQSYECRPQKQQQWQKRNVSITSDASDSDSLYCIFIVSLLCESWDAPPDLYKDHSIVFWQHSHSLKSIVQKVNGINWRIMLSPLNLPFFWWKKLLCAILLLVLKLQHASRRHCSLHIYKLLGASLSKSALHIISYTIQGSAYSKHIFWYTHIALCYLYSVSGENDACGHPDKDSSCMNISVHLW